MDLDRPSLDDGSSSSVGDRRNLLNKEYREILDKEYHGIKVTPRKRWFSVFGICNYIVLAMNTVVLLSIMKYLRAETTKAANAYEGVKLVTDDFTKGSIEWEVRTWDDVLGPHGSAFQGPPTPELDKAWMDTMEGYNLRIPAPGFNKASNENRTLVVLQDGSGDMLAVPAFLHQIHCLKTIREFQFGEHYPRTWRRNKPKEGEAIGAHIDHCLDSLRQAVMCHGDMTLLMYEWWPENPIPQTVVHSPHKCANWDVLSGWVKDHKVEPWGPILRNPFTGIVPYPLNHRPEIDPHGD